MTDLINNLADRDLLLNRQLLDLLDDRDRLINYRLTQGINLAWITAMMIFVFLMRVGFAFREAGMCRLKNVQAVLYKHVLDICFSTLIWWFTGYAFAWGRDVSNFLGETEFASENFEYNHAEFANWIFQWALAMVASAIVLGPVAERMTLWGIILFNMFFIGWVYPVVVHCLWPGWLGDLGYEDQAGGGVVLMTAGMAGLFLSMMVGSRIDRYSPAHVDDFRANNIPFTVLGSMLLWVGFFGFNCGSTYGTVGRDGLLVVTAAMNTIIASATAGIVAALVHYFANRRTNFRYSNTYLTGGCLAGCVAIASGCAQVLPWAAFCYGVVAGLVYVVLAKIIARSRLDDPLDAIAIFLGAGFFGTILTSFFHKYLGIFYGHATLFGCVWLAFACVLAWVGIHTVIFSFILKALGLLREDANVELLGLDQSYYGGMPYAYDPTTVKAMTIMKMADEQGIVIDNAKLVRQTQVSVRPGDEQDRLRPQEVQLAPH